MNLQCCLKTSNKVLTIFKCQLLLVQPGQIPAHCCRRVNILNVQWKLGMEKKKGKDFLQTKPLCNVICKYLLYLPDYLSNGNWFIALEFKLCCAEKNRQWCQRRLWKIAWITSRASSKMNNFQHSLHTLSVQQMSKEQWMNEFLCAFFKLFLVGLMLLVYDVLFARQPSSSVSHDLLVRISGWGTFHLMTGWWCHLWILKSSVLLLYSNEAQPVRSCWKVWSSNANYQILLFALCFQFQ